MSHFVKINAAIAALFFNNITVDNIAAYMEAVADVMRIDGLTHEEMEALSYIYKYASLQISSEELAILSVWMLLQASGVNVPWNEYKLDAATAGATIN